MKQTATERYEEEVKRTNSLIYRLQMALLEHKSKQAREPYNWGFIGELRYVNEKLEELMPLVEGEIQAEGI